ncbi:MAG: DUF559 domain-containing protein [Asticcacaulis sp.]
MARQRSALTNRARSLRKADNGAEAKLWHALRNRHSNGQKFRRQYPIGRYIADFVCIKSRLVIELDGSQHVDDPKDLVRNAYINAHGWSVARFWSGDVLAKPETVLDTIAAICDGQVTEPVDSFEFRFHPVMQHSSTHAPEQDSKFMRRAIELAMARMGRTWPNPPVGCVIVKDGIVIGEGATGDGGQPHAEEIALDAAGDAAKGATAYVTLEPCGQRSSGAASCSEKLIAAGIERVVYACADPSPLASHQGPRRMHDAGIIVECGLLADEANILIEGFVHHVRTGLPLLSEDEAIAYDAVFIRDPGLSLDDDLRAWAAKGYRRLLWKSQS